MWWGCLCQGKMFGEPNFFKTPYHRLPQHLNAGAAQLSADDTVSLTAVFAVFLE